MDKMDESTNILTPSERIDPTNDVAETTASSDTISQLSQDLVSYVRNLTTRSNLLIKIEMMKILHLWIKSR